MDEARLELRSLLAVPASRRTAEQERRIRACTLAMSAASRRKRKKKRSARRQSGQRDRSEPSGRFEESVRRASSPLGERRTPLLAPEPVQKILRSTYLRAGRRPGAIKWFLVQGRAAGREAAVGLQGLLPGQVGLRGADPHCVGLAAPFSDAIELVLFSLGNL